MFTATIQSTNIIPGDPLNLQCFALFDDGNGTTFTISYTYPVGGDPLDQINSDLSNYNVATQAVGTSASDLQTALTASNSTAISLDSSLTASVGAVPVTSLTDNAEPTRLVN